MFLRFYPDSHEHAQNFVGSVTRSGNVPTAVELQDHFIKHRTTNSCDTSAYVHEGCVSGVNMYA